MHILTFKYTHTTVHFIIIIIIIIIIIADNTGLQLTLISL